MTRASRKGLSGWLLAIALLAGAIGLAGTAPPGPEAENRPCHECHGMAASEFARTAMARAACSSDFLSGWKAKERPDACLRCHAPRGGAGVVCADCHGPGPHPYPPVDIPAVCGHCHDAPGENTVRGFLASPAARQGKDCLDCHSTRSGGRTSHDFTGPTRQGFLDRVARLRLLLRDGESGRTAVVQIRHRAGHALPGGTTGRAVWLQVEGLDAGGRRVWVEQVRFGWEHLADASWRDRTLLPGRVTIVEIARPGRQGARRLRAVLRYRFRPGQLDVSDPREVVLDRIELALPGIEPQLPADFRRGKPIPSRANQEE